MENSKNRDEFTEGFMDDATFASKSEVPEASVALDANANVDPDICAAMMKELSPAQMAAALAEDETILLIAPAGTGKTKTLTARVANMYASGVAPSRVLTCTYTNAAAQELKDRLTPALRIPIEDLWIGTLHSIGLRILRAHAQEVGLTGADAIVDEDQGMQIIFRILGEMSHYSVNTPDERVVAKRALRFIEDAKTRLITPADAAELFEHRSLDWAAGIGGDEIEIYRRYTTFLKLYDMIDYNDMLSLTTSLLENNPEIGGIWRAKFDAILVDEYQDLSTLQIRLLKNLVTKGVTKLFCAADDDQTIYQWRGSSLESTVRFEQYWPNTNVMHLTDNYRTPKPIFDKASRLIRHVADRHAKSIRTKNDPKALVRVIEAPDAATEKQLMLEVMLDAMQSYGSKPEDVAVLCRTNKLCAEVATFLAANGLQVNMHEGLPLNTQPVATLIAWMQLATKADNPLMFERMVRYPETLLDQGKIREVEQRVQARNERGNDRIGPVGYIVDMDARGKISAGTGAKRFVELVAEVRDMLSEENRLSSPFARVGEHVGVKAAAAASENAQDHAYTRFVMLADEMVEQIGLAKTLASLTSLDFNAGRTGVNVATMHSAKGLEFDIVFAPGWEEGEFPSRQRENEGSIDEERRLAYVTITRPKKMLVVSYAQSRKGQARPSRFIAEMDVNYDGEVQFDTAA
jgi:DNA helicase-2/ATP-dependent DNA helicase PcrA